MCESSSALCIASDDGWLSLLWLQAKQKMSAHSRASYENEIALMKSFRGCPRIVQLYDSQISDATSEVCVLLLWTVLLNCVVLARSSA